MAPPGPPGPPGFSDPDAPASARVYNYWTGGHDHYQADRDLADQITGVCPGMPRMAREARGFTRRAVQAAAGAGWFLDLGCGYPRPAGEATHDIVRECNPDAAVAYVDHDRDVADLCRWEYVTERKAAGVAAVCADLRDPAAILRNPAFEGIIDTARPGCVLASMVLHFTAPEAAAAITAGYMARCAPGTWLAATVARNDDPVRWRQVRDGWEARTGRSVWNYTQAEFTALFSDLEPVMAPGPTGPHGAVYVLGGTGRKT